MPRPLALCLLLILSACTTETYESLDAQVETDPEVDEREAYDAYDEGEALPMGIDGLGMQLMGTWRSADDPMSVIRFEDGEMVEVYDDDEMTRAAYRLDTNCPGSQAEGSGHLIAGDDCFVILGQPLDTLRYSRIGGRGNTLRYVRAE